MHQAATSDLVEGELDSEGADQTEFGRALAVAGGIALVGAPRAQVGEVSSGAVLAFARKGGAWLPAGTLGPTDPEDGQRFGDVVAFTGSLAAVTASGMPGGQTVSLVQWANGWSPAEAIVSAPKSEPGDSAFGYALALDAKTLFVGAPFGGGYEGRVYVYRREGVSWAGPKTLAPDPDYAESALYGCTIALDGDRLAIGALGEAPSGGVYLLERTPEGLNDSDSWAVLKHIIGPDGAASFGSALALIDDTLAVGAPQDGQGGTVYVYRLSDDSAEPDTTLRRTDPEPNDYFGSSLAFSNASLFVAAPGVTSSDTAGLVYEYRRQDDWAESAELSAPRRQQPGFFGAPLTATRNSTLLASDIPTAYAFLPALGGACTEDYECDSGHCSEGVCCNEACNDTCHSCLAKFQTSDGVDGECARVSAGTDPRSDCTRSDEPCGTTGECNADGACAVVPTGRTCSEASCASATQSLAVGRCDGLGKCRIPDPVECEAGYLCQSAQCENSCRSAADCDQSAGYYCFNANCVIGARCSLDRAIAYSEHGDETTCIRLLCEDGACLSACLQTDDCSHGLVCDPYTHDCITETSLAAKNTTTGGCALATHGVRNTSSGTAWFLMFTIGVASLRTRRSAQPRSQRH